MDTDINMLMRLVILLILGLVSLLPLFIVLTIGTSVILGKFFPEVNVLKDKRKPKLKVVKGGKK